MQNLKQEIISGVIAALSGESETTVFDNHMVGCYVIVRCRDAGVHAGYLDSHNGRECVLRGTRRLWYWKPANGAKFLSGVANNGLHEDSKISEAVDLIHLTENCEIIICTKEATKSIREIKADAN